jgi:hypothetical protein
MLCAVKLHREVILRFIETAVRSEISDYDSLIYFKPPHRRDIQRFEEPLQRTLSIFGLRVGFDYSYALTSEGPLYAAFWMQDSLVWKRD